MDAARTLVSLEEYLRTSYADGDREYIDGEVVEKTTPPWEHGEMQTRLAEVFYELRKRGFGCFTGVEVRSRTGESRVRLPDFSVYLERPGEGVLTAPPYIAVEVLSPDDRASYLFEKLREYRAWGAAYVWVIDPMRRTMAEFGSDGLREVGVYRLAEYGLEVSHADLFGEG